MITFISYAIGIFVCLSEVANVERFVVNFDTRAKTDLTVAMNGLCTGKLFQDDDASFFHRAMGLRGDDRLCLIFFSFAGRLVTPPSRTLTLLHQDMQSSGCVGLGF